IGYGTVIGNDPQDLKYRGEETWVEIGSGTIIREYSTINRGSTATGKTTIGERCFLMTYVHIAHDCAIGNDVIIANGVQMAGHVIARARAELPQVPEVETFLQFIEASQRGVMV